MCTERPVALPINDGLSLQRIRVDTSDFLLVAAGAIEISALDCLW